jgi:hypothetical protein
MTSVEEYSPPSVPFYFVACGTESRARQRTWRIHSNAIVQDVSETRVTLAFHERRFFVMSRFLTPSKKPYEICISVPSDCSMDTIASFKTHQHFCLCTKSLLYHLENDHRCIPPNSHFATLQYARQFCLIHRSSWDISEPPPLPPLEHEDYFGM